jgi:hypothetical protein
MDLEIVPSTMIASAKCMKIAKLARGWNTGESPTTWGVPRPRSAHAISSGADTAAASRPAIENW